MYKKIAKISTCSTLSDLKIRNPLFRLYKDKKLKEKLLKKYPFNTTDSTFLDESGYHIQLPIITSKGHLEDENYVQAVIEKINYILLKLDVHIVILESCLLQYKQAIQCVVADGKDLGVIFIKELIEKAKTLVEKPSKDISYILVEGEKDYTDYVLNKMTEGINALTLITDNSDRYEMRLQQILEDTGLIVELEEKQLKQSIFGDLVIDCSNGEHKMYYSYHKETIILGTLFPLEVAKNIVAKRKTLKIIYDFDIIYKGKVMEKDILFAKLLNDSRILRSMQQFGYREGYGEKIDELFKRYPIEFCLKAFN